ncbi:AtpZ/AtpI family protein [Pseudenhygromyxa sp. WMMC2535]|uniref:AtpZ/AtpI family protein n=1 Tax=Pseudenhygromyxa sp. WMMC2535 TaxID=2712867 RepID=UPI001551F553|nr:AtpZ/AtpI family protein [Pseudenhygromyxa sp. WMMC2535]NVB42686.1 AtpZ/AtpI family protein [Pseudenhygromyxa sp. WMMC2535]
MASEEPKQAVDEARHRELVDKHVYGDPSRRTSLRGRAAWFEHTSSASLGLEIGLAIGGTTLLARWIENTYTHWSPWTTLIGFGVGLGAAIKAVVRTIREYHRELDARQAADAGAQGEAGEGAAAKEAVAETAEAGEELSP